MRRAPFSLHLSLTSQCSSALPGLCSWVLREAAMPSADILIIGAGPTGLVLALWLARLGVRIRVIDKAVEAGTTSRAVAVQARTLELHRQLGLAETLVEQGVEFAAANL